MAQSKRRLAQMAAHAPAVVPFGLSPSKATQAIVREASSREGIDNRLYSAYHGIMMIGELPMVEKQGLPCCGIADIAPEDLGHVAAVFKALSDETRLKILQAISRTGELCECNIVPSFGLSQPTISYHLKVLREAGLIRSDRRGQWVYHRVNAKALLGAVRHLTDIG